MCSLLLLGVRYRLANGLRRAMRIWGTAIVMAAIAVGLRAQPNVDLWIHRWKTSAHPAAIAFAASFAVAILVRGMLQRALRRHGQRDFLLLPLTRMQRLAIDAASIVVFTAVPYGALLVAAAQAGALGSTLAAIAAADALLLYTLYDEVVAPNATRGSVLAPLPGEVRWLLRGRGIGGAVLLEILAIAAARVAIHNNGVSSTQAVARIEGIFAAIGAVAVAFAIVKARAAMRPFRSAEVMLPVTSAARMRALCVSAIIAGAPLTACGLAAPFAFSVLLSLVLLGESFSVRREKREWELSVIGSWAAIGAAIDMRAATAAALILLPYAWTVAVKSDSLSDAPLVAEAA